MQTDSTKRKALLPQSQDTGLQPGNRTSGLSRNPSNSDPKSGHHSRNPSTSDTSSDWISQIISRGRYESSDDKSGNSEKTTPKSSVKKKIGHSYSNSEASGSDFIAKVASQVSRSRSELKKGKGKEKENSKSKEADKSNESKSKRSIGVNPVELYDILNEEVSRESKQVPKETKVEMEKIAEEEEPNSPKNFKIPRAPAKHLFSHSDPLLKFPAVIAGPLSTPRRSLNFSEQPVTPRGSSEVIPKGRSSTPRDSAGTSRDSVEFKPRDSLELKPRGSADLTSRSEKRHSKIPHLHFRSSDKSREDFSSSRNSSRSDGVNNTPVPSPGKNKLPMKNTMTMLVKDPSFFLIKQEVFPTSDTWLKEAIQVIIQECQSVLVNQNVDEKKSRKITLLKSVKNNNGLKIAPETVPVCIKKVKTEESHFTAGFFTFDYIGSGGRQYSLTMNEESSAKAYLDTRKKRRIYSSKDHLHMRDTVALIHGSRPTIILTSGSGKEAKHRMAAIKSAGNIKQELEEVISLPRYANTGAIIDLQLRTLLSSHSSFCKRANTYGSASATIATCTGDKLVVSTIGSNKIYLLREVTVEDPSVEGGTKETKCLEVASGGGDIYGGLGKLTEAQIGKPYRIACAVLNCQPKDRVIICSPGTYSAFDSNVSEIYPFKGCDLSSADQRANNVLSLFKICKADDAAKLSEILESHCYDAYVKKNTQAFPLAGKKEYSEEKKLAIKAKTGFCAHAILAYD